MTTDTSIETYLSEIDEIPGWFEMDDVRLFRWVNATQRTEGISGDLLEIGVYRGKSAVLLGYFLSAGERLVVCDPFSAPVQSCANAAENVANYSGLGVGMFHRVYGSFHKALPVILECSSTDLPSRIEMTRTYRFVHIDGSHLYEIVRQDIATAKSLLVDGGVIALDDYRSFHTPGVAAAVWEELARGELVPLCVTQNKMYAQWGTSGSGRLESLKAWSRDPGQPRASVEVVFGRELVRIEPVVGKQRPLGHGWRRSWRRARVPRWADRPPTVWRSLYWRLHAMMSRCTRR